jgi:type I restriction enzyme R subunit
VVIIFDECHRSQFGDMHTAITKAFKNYHLFGFTGTPIFAANAGSGAERPGCARPSRPSATGCTPTPSSTRSPTRTCCPSASTTSTLIKLPPGAIDDKQVSGDRHGERPPGARAHQPGRRAYTLDHFDQKTKRSQTYAHGGRRVSGFNALFATSSIEAARIYYNAFGRLQDERPGGQRLKVGLIYSYAANEAVADDFVDEEGFETDQLSASAREFLEDAIQDYNEMFGTSFDTSAERFQNYYKDISQRLKNREIDLVIVVNMFLTGFDATTLNTLWVDKNLRAHGLLQAYSRTNRILNSVKTFGNIVSFRDLEEETNDAIALFGNKDARGVVLLQPFAHYYESYAAKVAELLAAYPLDADIVGEAAQKEFIALWGAILRLRNILTSFDDFAGQEILTPRQVQDYTSMYLDLYAEFRPWEGRGQGVDRRRRRLRNRARQAGRDQRRLHPHAGREVPRRQGRRRRPRDQGADHAGHRRQPVLAQQEGPHRGVRRFGLGLRGHGAGVEGLYRRQARPRAGRHHR